MDCQFMCFTDYCERAEEKTEWVLVFQPAKTYKHHRRKFTFVAGDYK
jgi:hypothetical protein